MSLLRVTMMSMDGRKFPMLINESEIASLDPDTRGDKVPSKSVLKRKDGKMFFLAETFEEILDQLNKGK